MRTRANPADLTLIYYNLQLKPTCQKSQKQKERVESEGDGEWRARASRSPTRHFLVLSKVCFLILKYFFFEAYPLLAPKCRVGATR